MDGVGNLEFVEDEAMGYVFLVTPVLSNLILFTLEVASRYAATREKLALCTECRPNYSYSHNPRVDGIWF